MSELQEKLSKKRKPLKKRQADKGAEFSCDDFLPKENYTLNAFQMQADYLTERKEIKTEKFSLSKNFRFKQSSDVAQLALNIFTLLSRSKQKNAINLVNSLIQNKNLNPNELKPFIPKKDAGRKKAFFDKKTGKVFNVKEPNKTILELYNAGKEPEEIRDFVISDEQMKKHFPRKRTPKAKADIFSLILRILRKNKHLLTRPNGRK